MSIAPAPHPLLERLTAQCGFVAVSAQDFDAYAAQPGHTLVFFSEDHVRYRETLDLAVILPELHRAFAGAFRVALLMPEEAKRIHARYGFRRWPAFVLLRDGAYVGAIDGVRNWDDYVGELARLLAADPSRPPAIGVAVKSIDTAGGCQAPVRQ